MRSQRWFLFFHLLLLSSSIHGGRNVRPTNLDLSSGGAREDGKFHNASAPMSHQFVNPHHGLWLPGQEKWDSSHTNNWAVIVDTSIFWYNYRHVANALAVYYAVKKLGIPDSNIILMLGDDIACNPRNAQPGTVYHDRNHKLNVYGDDVEVDYRGYEVSVENVLRVLTGRHDEDVPRSKRMMSDQHSNILVYMTGHGGDEFLKFLDQTEITSDDLADAFAQMWALNRYHEIFFMADTCQASTMYYQFTSPNIIGLGSSTIGESSWAHGTDSSLGVALVDKFTHFGLGFLKRVQPDSSMKLTDLFHMKSWSWNSLSAQAVYRHDLLMSRPLDSVKITDFFGSIGSATPLSEPPYPIEKAEGGTGAAGTEYDEPSNGMREEAGETPAAQSGSNVQGAPTVPSASSHQRGTATHQIKNETNGGNQPAFVLHQGLNIQFIGAGLVFLSILLGLSLQGFS